MRRLTLVTLAAVLGLAVAASAWAQGSGQTATVEVRVWQDVEDEREIHVSARPARGSWRTLGTIPLPLDDGLSSTGRYRYGDIAIEVPVLNWASPVIVQVRVWQHVREDRNIHISARGSGGSWDTLGTIPLALDAGFSSTLSFRYGDIRLDVPLPDEGVKTVAGQPGVHGHADGRGETASFALFGEPTALGLDVALDGSVVVADFRSHVIRRVAPDGTVSTIAGGNGAGFLDGAAEEARFQDPRDVVVAGDGSIYVAEPYRIRKISPDGVVTTIAGTGPTNSPGAVRDGRAAEATFNWVRAIALDEFGDLYIIEQYRVRRLTPAGWVDTVAGGSGLGYRDGPAGQALFDQLEDVAVDADGTVYLLDLTVYATGGSGLSAIVRVIDASGSVRTLHNSRPAFQGGVLVTPGGMAVSGDGTVYLSNTYRHQVLALSESGELVPVAGTGVEGYLDGARSEARFRYPAALAISDDGALFVADQSSSVVRVIVPGPEGFAGEAPPLAVIPQPPRLAGVQASLVAGNPGASYHTSERLADGAADTALFDSPWGVAIDALGRVIVADRDNHAIRRIASDGTVTTLAGGGGPGLRDGPGGQALFNSPSDVAVDEDGSIYVADTYNHRIRRIAPGGDVSTVAGGGAVGREVREPSDPIDGAATEARFRDPVRLAFDPNGDLLIAEDSGHVRRLSTSGDVSTEVGRLSQHAGVAVDDQGAFYFTGYVRGIAVQKATDDGAITTLFEDLPPGHGGVLPGLVPGIAVAPNGTVYLAAWVIGRVLSVSPRGEVTIVAERGSTRGLGGHFLPTAIVVSDDGDLIVADSGNNVIWRITLPDE